MTMRESSMTAKAVLDQDFLAIRHRILDIAASLDRLDRADKADEIADDPRRGNIQDAIRLLSDPAPDRAARVQLVFSDPYDESWRNG